jgi:hypothetical protein
MEIHHQHFSPRIVTNDHIWVNSAPERLKGWSVADRLSAPSPWRIHGAATPTCCRFGIGIAAVYRCIREAVAVMVALAPTLDEAMGTPRRSSSWTAPCCPSTGSPPTGRTTPGGSDATVWTSGLSPDVRTVAVTLPSLQAVAAAAGHHPCRDPVRLRAGHGDPQGLTSPSSSSVIPRTSLTGPMSAECPPAPRCPTWSPTPTCVPRSRWPRGGGGVRGRNRRSLRKLTLPHRQTRGARTSVHSSGGSGHQLEARRVAGIVRTVVTSTPNGA